MICRVHTKLTACNLYQPLYFSNKRSIIIVEAHIVYTWACLTTDTQCSKYHQLTLVIVENLICCLLLFFFLCFLYNTWDFLELSHLNQYHRSRSSRKTMFALPAPITNCLIICINMGKPWRIKFCVSNRTGKETHIECVTHKPHRRLRKRDPLFPGAN